MILTCLMGLEGGSVMASLFYRPTITCCILVMAIDLVGIWIFTKRHVEQNVEHCYVSTRPLGMTSLI